LAIPLSSTKVLLFDNVHYYMKIKMLVNKIKKINLRHKIYLDQKATLMMIYISLS